LARSTAASGEKGKEVVKAGRDRNRHGHSLSSASDYDHAARQKGTKGK